MPQFDSRAAEQSEVVAAGGRVGDGFYGRRVPATQRVLPAGASLACARRELRLPEAVPDPPACCISSLFLKRRLRRRVCAPVDGLASMNRRRVGQGLLRGAAARVCARQRGTGGQYALGGTDPATVGASLTHPPATPNEERSRQTEAPVHHRTETLRLRRRRRHAELGRPQPLERHRAELVGDEELVRAVERQRASSRRASRSR